MKIINFNRRSKSNNSDLLNTYIDWNKQYCYDLSRKITSLYDYMMWNYPEYFIFNAPNALNGKDDFEPYKSLVSNTIEPRLVQPYEQYVNIQIDEENTQTRSVFFPSRLNFHQGFYNQSIHGDAFLLCWKNGYWRTTYQEDYLHPVIRHFDTNNSSYVLDDLTLDHYNCCEKHNGGPFFTTKIVGTTQGVNTVSIWVGAVEDERGDDWGSAFNVAIVHWFGNDSDKTRSYAYETRYHPDKGMLAITFEDIYSDRNFVKITVQYNRQNGFYQVTPQTCFTVDKNSLTYKGSTEAILIHKNNLECLGYHIMRYEQDQLLHKWILEKTLINVNYYLDSCTMTFYEPDIYGENDIFSAEDINIASYMNFPAGYICILNKQPTGVNNEQNPIKNNLSSYLIAPMGNGGYYDIWWNNNILQVDYKANELNNFSNKLTINLAQNCRYVNPSNSTFAFTDGQLNVTIPNWYIDNDEVKPQLSDKHKNIWTGQEDLVAQPYFNGEKMFVDMQYDSFSSVVKQQNVHNFNAHVDEPFSLTVNLLIY